MIRLMIWFYKIFSGNIFLCLRICVHCYTGAFINEKREEKENEGRREGQKEGGGREKERDVRKESEE